MILVLLTGSAMAVTWEDENLDAIVQGWYPGAQGGAAIARILFGDANPEGKLPVTFYRTAEELPAFEDYSMKGRTYRYMKQDALYPFGYGLSYTDYTYADAMLVSDDIRGEKGVVLQAQVTNAGAVDGIETVQVYVGLEREDAPNPQLKKIVKVPLKAGFLDLGYGDIRDRDTLLDTFTGGMNLLTGITSGAVKTGNANGTLDLDTILDALSEGPLGLTARGVQAMDKYLDPNGPDYGDRAKLNSTLSPILQKMTESEHKTSTVYSDLGNKYQLIENLETKLKNSLDSLNVQYKDTVGADPYESIYEMFNNQYSYNAALQVGSNLMSSSLFDFIR